MFFLQFFSVNLKDVCNGRLDCPDKSDEINCKSIIFDQSYLRDAPPADYGKLQGPPLQTVFFLLNFIFFYKGHEEKVKLNVSLTLESILDLGTVHLIRTPSKTKTPFKTPLNAPFLV